MCIVLSTLLVVDNFKCLCFDMPLSVLKFHPYIFVNTIKLQRMISGFILKYKLQPKLLVLNKCFNYRHFYYDLKKKLFKKPPNFITFREIQDTTVPYFSVTNKTNILSKMLTGEGDQNLNVNYDDVLKAQKDGILIIDVRENSEIQETGILPGSIHIPMGDVTNILNSFSSEEFKQKFDRQKPTQNTKIILSCRSGKRSAMVQSDIRKIGYKNVFNYLGGWLDWESKQKI